MTLKKHKHKNPKPWYKHFWVWLIIIISILYLTTTSSIFEKVSLLFCLAFYLLGYYLAHNHVKDQLPKKQPENTEKINIITTVKYPLLVPIAQCAFCGKNICYYQLHVKFKNSAYICKACMHKYKFPISNTAITWVKYHTIDDFKKHLDKGQDFADIVLEIKKYAKPKKGSPKHWYERFWVWLLILIALIFYLLETSAIFSIKIFASLCLIFGVGILFLSDKNNNEEIWKKNHSRCALCGQYLDNETRFLKFMYSTYICKNCMLKYKFTPISKARAWAASHTVEDLKKYLDKGQDFTDIILATGNNLSTPPVYDSQFHKPWYKRTEIWLLIIMAFTACLTASFINIFIRIIVALLAIFFVCGARTSSKIDYDILTEQNDAQCALCGQGLYYSDKFLKLKGSTYICQDCMTKYKYAESAKNMGDWTASHTINDLKEYIDKGEDFTDISLEVQIQKGEKDQYIAAFKKKSTRYSHYYFNIDAKKIYIDKTLLFPERLVDASEIASYHINEKKHTETEKHFVTEYFVNNIPMGKTTSETKEYLDHLGLTITLTDNSEFEIKFVIIKSEMTSARVDSAYSQLEQVIAILDTWQDYEIEKKQKKKQTNDIMKELINYKALLEADIITKEDFDAKKKQLLDL
ncbi:SHOCT domain-containing protein [Lactobacillus sp. ESL0701]|uniref:SHOCT domain-containing protein n=1 Tax=Lactobacillus sp. ESL0701 TaxID=2983217 RepID=UPI0023F68E52|nr:SHOCT domain-containing protein [Lactobacillus sp. ESL0701]MDF7672301.1 SHOCT domain-containing protein [Lactobacillus sp. ESL0701]